ncbi:MAG: hypothetical protein ACTH31_15835, partial [Pseudoclavibacter sp.]
MRDYLSFARSRPSWNNAEYTRLAGVLELPRKGYVHKLSLGQRAGFSIACALASGAPYLIIDEAHAALDVPKRLALYEELVRANGEDGRTVVIASHNVGELERIAEDLIVLGTGELVESTTVEALSARYARLVGPVGAVRRAVAGHLVVAQRELGPTLEATVDISRATLDPQPDGVVVAPVDFLDAFVALIGRDTAANTTATLEEATS